MNTSQTTKQDIVMPLTEDQAKALTNEPWNHDPIIGLSGETIYSPILESCNKILGLDLQADPGLTIEVKIFDGLLLFVAMYHETEDREIGSEDVDLVESHDMYNPICTQGLDILARRDGSGINLCHSEGPTEKYEVDICRTKQHDYATACQIEALLDRFDCLWHRCHVTIDHSVKSVTIAPIVIGDE
jgi:hypothetical protein